MDFNALVEKAASVLVNGEYVDLRAPSLNDRAAIWQALSKANTGSDDDATDVALAWIECCAMALAATVIAEPAVDIEGWSRVVSLSGSDTAPHGLAELVETALSLTGLTGLDAGAAASANVVDHVADADNELGNFPTK